ncbi:hypothetical protein DHW03_12360 [Pedobacter yonginense]|uniref:Uncharacterized protein n=1 Tax=Pedobacter yonginense TaxID=651869 RepID=A0A317EP11_9SPHI|nr:hypothetical protein DHW03_12360 [Pedobacter yonginense]
MELIGAVWAGCTPSANVIATEARKTRNYGIDWFSLGMCTPSANIIATEARKTRNYGVDWFSLGGCTPSANIIATEARNYGIQFRKK